jgi:hypothetical protein
MEPTGYANARPVGFIRATLRRWQNVSSGGDVSFDMFVDTFEAGRSVGASAEVFARIFGPHLTATDGKSEHLRLSFSKGGGADAYVDGSGGCMFNHFGGDQFFECLFRFLQEIRGVAYWPAEGCSAAVADDLVLLELPADMVAALNPAVVRSGAELMKTVTR